MRKIFRAFKPRLSEESDIKYQKGQLCHDGAQLKMFGSIRLCTLINYID